MSKRNAVIIVIFFLLVIVFSFFFFFKKKDMLPAMKENIKEQQQKSIVQELNIINKLNPISDKEKIDLLKYLRTKEIKTEPLTSEQKLVILKSLVQ